MYPDAEASGYPRQARLCGLICSLRRRLRSPVARPLTGRARFPATAGTKAVWFKRPRNIC